MVFPQAIGFGARPMEVPGEGSVLCASGFFAFRLCDGEHVRPADWYEAVSRYGGDGATPDAMTPLPRAELLVLGAVSPATRAGRKISLRCGSVSKAFILREDPDAPDAPIVAGPDTAVWHEEDNPGGRGGPGDDRLPLIVDPQAPKRPLWLGPTPFDHPMRLRHLGTPDERSGIGWPADADAGAFHDAHEAFRCEALLPGDSLMVQGIMDTTCIDRLPAYRLAITSGRSDERWVKEPTWLQCVTLLPKAGLAAMIWRTAIELGDDALGESVIVLVAGLEDAEAKPKHEMQWAEVAVERWEDPVRALDDRPLLPAALAAAVTLPFAPPDSEDPIDARIDAAKAWVRNETGLPEENPFAASAPEEVGLADRMLDAASREEEPPDANRIGEMAAAVLAVAKRKHEAAGFPEPDPEQMRMPVPRGPKIGKEIEDRLRAPFQTERERSLAEHIDTHGGDAGMKGDALLSRLAETRLQIPQAPLPWPAMIDEEAVEFGNAVSDSLRRSDPKRHIDISGAVVEGREPLAGRRFLGLLAEETIWRGATFTDSEFSDTSFAGARFESCTFRDCRFERVNLSRAILDGNTFTRCAFRASQWTQATWMNCRFDECVLQNIAVMDAAMRSVEFTRGEWRQASWVDGLFVEVVFRGVALHEVTFSNVHAPYTRFERLSMFKVWSMSGGFPGSVFDRVEGTTCGFLAECHFDECRFIATRFAETGFSNAVFANATLERECRFDRCDLSGAVFAGTTLPGTRFTGCSMAMSVWHGARAAAAWFFGSILRGVDFADTELARAVFADADIAGTKFDPDRTIDADFRGTARADE